MSEPGWKAKAVWPNEDKENDHRQMHQHPNLQALTNTHTHTSWVRCVRTCFSESGYCISNTDLLQVSITHRRQTSHTRSKALSQQYTEKCLFPQHSTPINYELLTSHLQTRKKHRHTHRHRHTPSRAACKSTLNTCHNKELPATLHKEKYRQTPHMGHKTLANTYTNTHARTLARSFWLVNCTASSD